MPVFIGGITAVASDRVLAIIDFNYFSEGDNKAYLERLQERGAVFDAAGGSPKSIVVTDNELYISPISPLTLKKRNDRLHKEAYEFDYVEEN